MRVHHRPCLSPRCRKARQASRPRSCIRLPVETFRTEPSRPEMPIKIPHDLPARETLEREGVLIIRDTDEIRQDIRPLRIALQNLMPTEIETQPQIARLPAGHPLPTGK